ncbi:MAG TPA: efflux RND transporter periplasmic adaptor subunit [Elusimicrobiota bacterium]|nr:efflux RND transporter periplasmic adaptor subunit [Elusimicrobiota bacterium]
MRTKLLILAAATALTLTGCGGPKPSGDTASRAPAKKILYYRAPMDPSMTSPTPMKDSMGMDYVPVYADQNPAPEKGAFQVSPYRRQEIGLKLGKAEMRPLVKTIRTVGWIAYDPELYQTEEDYLAARATFLSAQKSQFAQSKREAQSLLKSSDLRLRLLGLSAAQIGALGRSGKPDEGLLLSSGKNSALWLYADVFESDLPLVRIGQTVEATSPSLPGRVFRGKILSIDPVLNPKTRAARVRAEIRDPEGVLRPDLYLDAAVQVDLGTRLAVPRDAVVDTGLRQTVFVDLGNGYLAPRQVVAGEHAGDWVEILKGLKAGDQVVTSGNFLIDSESDFQAAAAAFGGPKGKTGAKP